MDPALQLPCARCRNQCDEDGTPRDPCESAAQLGHFECMAAALIVAGGVARGVVEGAADHAASKGHTCCLRLAWEYGAPLGGALLNAAGMGHTDCVAFIAGRDDELAPAAVELAYKLAVARTHFTAAALISRRYGLKDPRCALPAVAESNSPEAIRYLCRLGVSANTALRCAAVAGSVSCMKVALELGATGVNRILAVAARNGRTACVELALQSGATPPASVGDWDIPEACRSAILRALAATAAVAPDREGGEDCCCGPRCGGGR